MPIPGLPFSPPSSLGIIYDSDAEDVDVWADLGQPSEIVNVVVVVKAGVTLSGTKGLGTATPALSVNRFTLGSIVTLINNGNIEGAGKDGGVSDSNGVNQTGGGGGGGAGNDSKGHNGLGVYGHSTEPTSKGADGTSAGGGAGGIAQLLSNTTRSFANGQAGGHAIQSVSIEIIISNSAGNIWGGGGGGGGGAVVSPNRYDGGDGGDWGENGEDATVGGTGGTGGYAVRGTAVTFISGGISPNVEGLIA